MDQLTIKQLKEQASEEKSLNAIVLGQLQAVHHKETRNGKPYLQIEVSDRTGGFSLKVWNNHAQFQAISELKSGTSLRLQGRWSQNQYGIDSPDWVYASPSEEELAQMMSGDEELHQKQCEDWAYIEESLKNVEEPRLHALGAQFIKDYEARFRRTAAARKNHHARRGGLVEHVAQMMRTAQALSQAYPYLNQDLLIVAILLHDCGKMWENTYQAESLAQEYLLEGELLGHIPLGMQVCRDLWKTLESQNSHWEKSYYVDNKTLLLHLLHLIGSHHGTYEFGSPVLPRTPEAFALHYIDNLDAKLEMLKEAYEESAELAPGIYERHFPLPGNPVAPIPFYGSPRQSDPSDQRGQQGGQNMDEKSDDLLNDSRPSSSSSSSSKPLPPSPPSPPEGGFLF